MLEALAYGVLRAPPMSALLCQLMRAPHLFLLTGQHQVLNFHLHRAIIRGCVDYFKGIKEKCEAIFAPSVHSQRKAIKDSASRCVSLKSHSYAFFHSCDAFQDLGSLLILGCLCLFHSAYIMIFLIEEKYVIMILLFS